jgi:thioredoxin 1
VDHNPDTAARFQVMSIPAFLVFKQGKCVDTIIGAMPAERLEQKLARYL